MHSRLVRRSRMWLLARDVNEEVKQERQEAGGAGAVSVNSR